MDLEKIKAYIRNFEDYEEMNKICLEKLGITYEDAFLKYDSAFDFVYDLKHAGGDK